MLVIITSLKTFNIMYMFVWSFHLFNSFSMFLNVYFFLIFKNVLVLLRMNRFDFCFKNNTNGIGLIPHYHIRTQEEEEDETVLCYTMMMVRVYTRTPEQRPSVWVRWKGNWKEAWRSSLIYNNIFQLEFALTK